VGAFGGRREIMEQLAPLGPVYQAGTLSGNPVSMAAGLATLDLEATARALCEGLEARAAAAGIPLTSNVVGGMFGIFFTEEKTIRDFYQVTNCDVDRFKLFFHGMLERGVYLAPSAFEAAFVSSAHGDEEVKATLDAAEQVLATL